MQPILLGNLLLAVWIVGGFVLLLLLARGRPAPGLAASSPLTAQTEPGPLPESPFVWWAELEPEFPKPDHGRPGRGTV